MRFVQLANHFGLQYRHYIVAMDGIAGAFDLLAPDIDATIVAVENRRGDPWRNVSGFLRTLRQVKPDVLVTSNWGTIEWAAANLFSRIPHLHMEDGFGPEEAQRQLARRVWARRLLLRRATTVVPSQTLYALARDIWRLPERRLVQVSNGIDCLRFNGPADSGLVTGFRIRSDCPVIGALAPLRAEKNLSRLIAAFAELRRTREAQLVLVGDGPLRGVLQAQVDNCGLAADVIFTGFCSTPEKLLPAFTVFAVSSDTEQMPLSVLEAMAAGRPIAGTRVGDICQMVSEQNRPFIVEKTAGQLAGAIGHLLGNAVLASTIGQANARRASEMFDQRRMFESYRALFDHTAVPPSPINCERGRENGQIYEK